MAEECADLKHVVEGCPVEDGGPPCVLFCGGGWPGTRITTEAMTRAVNAERIRPELLGCQPLEQRARDGLRIVRERSM